MTREQCLRAIEKRYEFIENFERTNNEISSFIEKHRQDDLFNELNAGIIRTLRDTFDTNRALIESCRDDIDNLTREMFMCS